MRGQYVRGTVLISGPSADALAATDPLVQDDQTSIEVIEWDVHQILGIGSFDPPLVGPRILCSTSATWRRTTGRASSPA